MEIIDHNAQPSEEWRAGVTTRMHISALTGASQLTIFEQWCSPGQGAPTHWHSVEEVLTVLAGEAEIWIDSERMSASAGQSALVPAERRHGFRNSGKGVLHVRAVLAAPVFEAYYDDRADVARRWIPR